MAEIVKKDRKPSDYHLTDNIYLKKKVGTNKIDEPPVPLEFSESHKTYTKR